MASQSHHAPGMETVLLVGEPPPPDALPLGSGRSASRLTPSFKGALERVGYRVVNASDGAGVLRRLSEQPPDVIVLAGAVPDMELLDLCVAVRRDPAATTTPFILMGDAAGRAGRPASRAGADLVFPPTVGPVEVAERLRRLF
jgi:CheY-like chemotaxis protein